MMQSPDPVIQFGRRGRVAILCGFTLLILAGVGALMLASASERQAKVASHSREIRETQALLFRELQDADSAQRGYLLTGDHAYLDPFHRAERYLPRLKSRLAGLVPPVGA